MTAPTWAAAMKVPAWAVDAALGGFFLALMLVERAPAISVIAAALTLVVAAGLLLRRRFPLGAYLAGTAALSAEALFFEPSPISPYANLIAAYSLGLYATRNRARWGSLAIVLGVLAYFKGSLTWSTPLGVALLIWLLAWAVGYSSARRKEEQESARALLDQQVISEERGRIARELHDLVGHAVNVMLVQAGAARRVLDREPDQARKLLQGLESTGNQALAELDRMLGMLRRDDPANPVDEQGLADLSALAQRLSQAGILVTVEVEAEAYQVPKSVGLSAFRIAQEALTNSLKHGDARAAKVLVRKVGDTLAIDVSDDGRGPAPGYAPGRGLLGIGERVMLFGGTVRYGRGDRGGFRLQAMLPLA